MLIAGNQTSLNILEDEDGKYIPYLVRMQKVPISSNWQDSKNRPEKSQHKCLFQPPKLLNLTPPIVPPFKCTSSYYPLLLPYQCSQLSWRLLFSFSSFYKSHASFWRSQFKRSFHLGYGQDIPEFPAKEFHLIRQTALHLATC